MVVNNQLSASIDQDTRRNCGKKDDMICEWQRRSKHMRNLMIVPYVWSHITLYDFLHDCVLSAVMFQSPLFIHACSLSSTLHDSQWDQCWIDPLRARLLLVSLSPLSFSVLTRLIPHSLPVKWPKPWLPVAHANIPPWMKDGMESERDRERQTNAEML